MLLAYSFAFFHLTLISIIMKIKDGKSDVMIVKLNIRPFYAV